jgi:hypothetical protein
MVEEVEGDRSAGPAEPAGIAIATAADLDAIVVGATVIATATAIAAAATWRNSAPRRAGSTSSIFRAAAIVAAASNPACRFATSCRSFGPPEARRQISRREHRQRPFPRFPWLAALPNRSSPSTGT